MIICIIPFDTVAVLIKHYLTLCTSIYSNIKFFIKKYPGNDIETILYLIEDLCKEN